MSIKNLKYLIPVIIINLNLYCTEEKNPLTTGVVPSILKVNIQNKWNTRSSALYKVEVWVSDPQGVNNLEDVNLTVIESSTGNQILSDASLYDDGAYFYPGAGDVLAGDGVYSNRYRTTDIANVFEETEYIFRFAAIDKQNNQSQLAEYLVILGPNSQPEIHHIKALDTLPLDISDVIFSITVSDSNGIDDIVNAYFESENIEKGYTKFEQQLYNDGDYVNHGDQTPGDSVFSTRITSDFVSGKKGVYNLIFYVEDTFHEKNTEIAQHVIVVGNLAGKFLEFDVPKAMNIPSSYLMTVKVSDPEGLSDIDSVYFYSRKPDSSLANFGLPIMMMDDGTSFDRVAGDGIYSFILISSEGDTPGIYTFTFYMRDKAGNLTGPVEKTTQLIGN